MDYKYLSNLPLDQAIGDYITNLVNSGFVAQKELVAVAQACGRILYGAVYANICAPHYNAAAMDGIALDAAITFGATETTPVILDDDQYWVVDTGDPLTSGCDAVVMVEDVVCVEDGVKLFTAAAPWQHIRQIGEDICAGDMILPAYATVTPSAIGAMLAGGVMEIEVIKKPIVGIIPTGDEIISPCTNPGSGDIIEFNSSIFSAMLKEWSAEAKVYPIVKDKLDLITNSVRQAADECDIVLLNAGSSAGREDYSSQAIATVGELLYHGLAIKPGKPAVLGKAKTVPLIGVPGYPVSGIIILDQIVKPLLETYFHRRDDVVETVDAVLGKRLTTSLKYREFIRTRLGYVNGKMVATPLNRGAGVVSSFVKADGIIDVPQNCEGYEAGESVKVSLLRPLSDIERTIVITGSHDPLIDELANLLVEADRNAGIASSHVGSMGGLMAVKRGEAHLCGTHLLDEASGQYNIPYVQKQFPGGRVILVECVYRQQGLMVSKGNPHRIHDLSDVARLKLDFVNRQKGAGTRILTDYLMKQQGIAVDDLRGYQREEFTHTGVAAQIAGQTADAGMGIYSAAKIYDLDFIPVCEEQYDFLISAESLELQTVQKMIRVLSDQSFKKRLLELGGYRIENPGRIRCRF